MKNITWSAIRVAQSAGIVLLVFLMVSCRDDSWIVFKLPQATQQGKNTFGFLLDGKVWTNYGEVCYLFGPCEDNLHGYYYSYDKSISISAVRLLHLHGNVSEERFYLDLPRFNAVRDYSTHLGDTMHILYDPPHGNNTYMYVLSDTNPDFRVNITELDTVNGIVSGIFFGTLVRRANPGSAAMSSTEKVKIASGRFDIDFIP